jgi:hypothetical protein
MTYNRDEDKCANTECGCHRPRSFWVELDKDGNPTGEICWDYYSDDKPIVGVWIRVQEVQ